MITNAFHKQYIVSNANLVPNLGIHIKVFLLENIKNYSQILVYQSQEHFFVISLFQFVEKILIQKKKS